MKVSLDTWVQLLGLIGVLGGLLALIIELNQSQKLSRAAAYQTRISEIQESQRELALSGDFAAILQKFNSEGIGSLARREGQGSGMALCDPMADARAVLSV